MFIVAMIYMVTGMYCSLAPERSRVTRPPPQSFLSLTPAPHARVRLTVGILAKKCEQAMKRLQVWETKRSLTGTPLGADTRRCGCARGGSDSMHRLFLRGSQLLGSRLPPQSEAVMESGAVQQVMAKMIGLCCHIIEIEWRMWLAVGCTAMLNYPRSQFLYISNFASGLIAVLASILVSGGMMAMLKKMNSSMKLVMGMSFDDHNSFTPTAVAGSVGMLTNLLDSRNTVVFGHDQCLTERVLFLRGSPKFHIQIYQVHRPSGHLCSQHCRCNQSVTFWCYCCNCYLMVAHLKFVRAMYRPHSFSRRFTFSLRCISWGWWVTTLRASFQSFVRTRGSRICAC